MIFDILVWTSAVVGWTFVALTALNWRKSRKMLAEQRAQAEKMRKSAEEAAEFFRDANERLAESLRRAIGEEIK